MRTEEEIKKEINRLTETIGKEIDLEYADKLITRKWALKWVLKEEK